MRICCCRSPGRSPGVRTATAISRLPTSIAATRGYTISTTVPFQSPLTRHAARGSCMKIKILRLALNGSNPGYPTGTGPSVNLRAGLAGTKNKRRQRATPLVSPTQGGASPAP